MTTETKERIKKALIHLNAGRITIFEALQYCAELENLNCSESADLMKTLVKAYDTAHKRNGLSISKTIKL